MRKDSGSRVTKPKARPRPANASPPPVNGSGRQPKDKRNSRPKVSFGSDAQFANAREDQALLN